MNRASSLTPRAADWLAALVRGRAESGRRRPRRPAGAGFESLEPRAVPAALPLAVAAPATAATSREAVAPLAFLAAPVTVRPAVVAAVPATPTVGLAVASNSGSKTDTRTNVVAPFVAGRATPGTVVNVTVTGVAGFPAAAARAVTPVRVPASGLWSVRLPTLAAGAHVVTARVVAASGKQSAAATASFVVDTTRPTATLSFVPNTDTVTLRVSKPVAGVSLQSFRISGTTADGVRFTDLPLTDSRIAQTTGVGSVSLARSADGLTYTIKTQFALATPGTYTLRLLPAGIVDNVGNPLAAEARLTVKVV